MKKGYLYNDVNEARLGVCGDVMVLVAWSGCSLRYFVPDELV